MNAPVEVAQWGRDHASTLLYVETCNVDRSGKIEDARMRVDGHQHPTRLREGELHGHSDWDVLADLEHFGLVQKVADAWLLTDLGWKVAHRLRVARARREDMQRLMRETILDAS